MPAGIYKRTEKHRKILGKNKNALGKHWKLLEETKEKMRILESLGIDYIFQFRPKGYSKLYDFYIPKLNLLIEYDSKYWHSLPGMKERDTEKTQYAINNGYKLLRINKKI